MEALDGERSPQESAWAAREVIGNADVPPLILLSRTLLGGGPLLDLIEHAGRSARAAPICASLRELLDARPAGGRTCSSRRSARALSEKKAGARGSS